MYVLVLSGLANFRVSYSDSTSPLSQNAQVTIGSAATKNCLKMGVHSMGSRTVGVNPVVRQFNGYTYTVSLPQVLRKSRALILSSR
jgi:hypothetical protein